MSSSKICSKCGIEKPLSDFHKAPTGRFGVRGDCKKCVRDRQNNNYCSSEAKKKYAKTKNECPECGGLKSRYSDRCRNCAQPPSNIESPRWRTDKEGYVVSEILGEDGGRVHLRQHRWIMERHLGRKLMAHEQVHHKNGQRDDNRLENLELWSVSQPGGQRVEDKIEWCRWFLEQYEES